MSQASPATPVVVLLAEDEALLRMFAADVLSDDGGFKVVEAANADEALTLLEARHGIRALVTDVEMPGSMNGYTLARVVKRGWPEVGLVVMSGRLPPGPGMMPEGGVFVPKPFTAEALLAAVRSVLHVLPNLATPPVMRAPTIQGPQMSNGLDGGLAQPLSDPEE